MIFKRRPKADPAGAIETFWAWWATARPQAEQAIADGRWHDDLIAAMNDRITAIHPDLQWEFAAGTTSRHLLVVTSAGDRSLRSLAERWRRAGPPADDTFEYASARQAEPSALDATLEIDGRTLDLSLLRFGADLDDSTAQIDVRVWHPLFTEMPDGARTQVSFLALDWLLGEDAVEIWVGEIEAITAPGPSSTGTDLAAMVAALADPSGEPRWAVLSGSRQGRPMMATVQVPLRAARWPAADVHVELSVAYREANDGGFPVGESQARLHALEDRILAYADGPVLVAHETTAGVRTYHLYADRPAAVEALKPIIASWPEGKVRTTVTEDPTWKRVDHLRP